MLPVTSFFVICRDERLGECSGRTSAETPRSCLVVLWGLELVGYRSHVEKGQAESLDGVHAL